MLITKIELDLTHLEDDRGTQQFPEPITFFAGAYLEKDFRETMQAFFGLTDKERAEKQQEYNADLLSRLACKEPKGFPGFEAGEDLKQSVYDYLSEKSEAKEYLAQNLVDEHFARVRRYSFRG